MLSLPFSKSCISVFIISCATELRWARVASDTKYAASALTDCVVIHRYQVCGPQNEVIVVMGYEGGAYLIKPQLLTVR